MGARERLIRMRKDLEGHVRGVLKVFGVCMTSVGTGELRRDFRDQLAAAAYTDPAIEMMSETFIPLYKTLCIARDALDEEVRMMARESDLAHRLMTVPPLGHVNMPCRSVGEVCFHRCLERKMACRIRLPDHAGYIARLPCVAGCPSR
jgi:hypothetical protein